MGTLLHFFFKDLATVSVILPPTFSKNKPSIPSLQISFRIILKVTIFIIYTNNQNYSYLRHMSTLLHRLLFPTTLQPRFFDKLPNYWRPTAPRCSRYYNCFIFSFACLPILCNPKYAVLPGIPAAPRK